MQDVRLFSGVHRHERIIGETSEMSSTDGARTGYNGGMKTDEILAAIDAEIAVLKQARAILTETESADERSPRAGGRPRKRRKMSAEARAKIAAAQKKRWAAILTKKGKA